MQQNLKFILLLLVITFSLTSRAQTKSDFKSTYYEETTRVAKFKVNGLSAGDESSESKVRTTILGLQGVTSFDIRTIASGICILKSSPDVSADDIEKALNKLGLTIDPKYLLYKGKKQ